MLTVHIPAQIHRLEALIRNDRIVEASLSLNKAALSVASMGDPRARGYRLVSE
jgi:hypothetical protein